jgi:hypothetical protein
MRRLLLATLVALVVAAAMPTSTARVEPGAAPPRALSIARSPATSLPPR